MMTIQRSAFLSVIAVGGVLALLSGCSGGNPSLSKAEDAKSQQRYDQALTRIDSALAKDSTNADAYLMKAEILREKADSTMAPDAYKDLYRQARAAEKKAGETGADVQETIQRRRAQAFSQESRRGTEAFRQGQKDSDPDAYRQAAAHFGAASATYPDSASVILNEAYAYLNRAQSQEDGTMTSVIPVLERYMETAEAPEANAYDILSALYLQNDQSEEAITLLETARQDLAERPTHFRLKGTLGLEYEGTVQAGGTSRSVEGTTPDRIMLDTREGTVSGTFKKGQTQGRLRVQLFHEGKSLEQTTVTSQEATVSADLETETPLAEIEGRLLNAYNQAGKTEKAMTEYQEQIEENPNNVTYRYNYGSMLLQADRFDKAVKQLKKATELEPGNVKAQYNLGAAYSNKARQIQDRISNVQDSLDTISERAVEENREPTDEERRMVNELDETKKELTEKKQSLFTKAVPPLERARKQSSSNGESFRKDACRALVTAYIQTERVEKAKEYEECAGLQVSE